MTTFRRGTIWTLSLLLLMAVLAILFVRVGVGWYLGSDRFRHQITRGVDRELKAEGVFQPLHLNGDTLYSDGYVAKGKAHAFFSDLWADQIRAVVNWRGLLGRRWEIDELNIQNLNVRFDAGPVEEMPREKAATPVKAQPKKESSWKLDLRKAEVAQSSWHWGAADRSGSLTKAGFVLTPSEGSWLIDARSGSLAQSGWPVLTIESAKLRYTGASLFVTESALRAGDGRLNVDGEIKFQEAADLQVHLKQVDFAPLVPPDWRSRLRGKVSGTAKVHAPLRDRAIEANGELQLVDTRLEGLPLLNQIARFTRTERFRQIALTRGSFHFESRKERTVLSNVVLESEGLLRAEGGCTITRNKKVEGVFQVGLTSASLQWLRGQSRVFTAARDGYYWTPVRISGSVDHLHEDLTKRLLAAAAGELLQNSNGTLEDAAKKLLDLIPH